MRPTGLSVGSRLVPGTVQTKGFKEQVANWFEFVGLVARTRLDFEAKRASLNDGTCPCDLLLGLVAGTTPLVCADL